MRYYWGQNVTFAWELGAEPGRQLSLPGYMESVVRHMDNTAIAIWVLNFTLEYGHSGHQLQCIVQIDNNIHKNYEAKAVLGIHFCGKFM